MMPHFLRAGLAGCAVLLPGLALAAAGEAGPAPHPPAPLAAAPVVPVAATTVPGAAEAPPGVRPAAALSDTQQYCQNIAGAAADARFAWQRKQLSDLQAKLKQRIADLDAKEAEFKAVLARRDALMKLASESVVGIYAHMKPDAAATQLAALDESVAASILAQLTQRQASTILNEIPADKAAKLVGAMTAAATPEKKS